MRIKNDHLLDNHPKVYPINPFEGLSPFNGMYKLGTNKIEINRTIKGKTKTPTVSREKTKGIVKPNNIKLKKSKHVQNYVQPSITLNINENFEIKDILLKSVADSTEDSGWANLASVGSKIRKYKSTFDVNSYGCKKLYDLIKTVDLFEIEERQPNNSLCKIIFVKKKKNIDFI